MLVRDAKKKNEKKPYIITPATEYIAKLYRVYTSLLPLNRLRAGFRRMCRGCRATHAAQETGKIKPFDWVLPYTTERSWASFLCFLELGFDLGVHCVEF